MNFVGKRRGFRIVIGCLARKTRSSVNSGAHNLAAPWVGNGNPCAGVRCPRRPSRRALKPAVANVAKYSWGRRFILLGVSGMIECFTFADASPEELS
jgi:hypothetical protein